MKKFTFLCAVMSVISVQLTLIPLESKDQGQLVALAKCKSRKENPQKPTQLSSRSHPRHLVGKRTAQKTPS